MTTPVFLAVAFHSIVLMESGYWVLPIGWLTAVVIGAGTVTGILALLRVFAGGGTATGTVASTQYYPELRVLETNLTVDDRWPGHRPGQFAFVTTDRAAGAHPFTISTAWNPDDRTIGFIAKELGDHTARLRDHLGEGRRAVLEGPYGNFTFDDHKPRQIWIGAGIGITPFVARMRHPARQPGAAAVDLFHSTTDVSDIALAKMRADAERAGVRLHILVSPRDGRLDTDKICAAVPDWSTASVWFCGPMRFGAALRRSFLSRGLSARDFHQELFEMR